MIRKLHDEPFPVAEAKAVANLLLDWAEDEGISVSPMKLQKLIFFPHADFLVQLGRPLVKQEFEAWDYGPVIPSLYAEFKTYRNAPILSRARSFNPTTGTKVPPALILNPTDKVLLRACFQKYKALSASELSRISHQSGGAWRQARSLYANGLNMDRRMSNNLIFQYYEVIPA